MKRIIRFLFRNLKKNRFTRKLLFRFLYYVVFPNRSWSYALLETYGVEDIFEGRIIWK